MYSCERSGGSAFTGTFDNKTGTILKRHVKKEPKKVATRISRAYLLSNLNSVPGTTYCVAENILFTYFLIWVTPNLLIVSFANVAKISHIYCPIYCAGDVETLILNVVECQTFHKVRFQSIVFIRLQSRGFFFTLLVLSILGHETAMSKISSFDEYLVYKIDPSHSLQTINAVCSTTEVSIRTGITSRVITSLALAASKFNTIDNLHPPKLTQFSVYFGSCLMESCQVGKY